MEPTDDQILKKIYFIKRAEQGEELVTLLKNKFKIIDAIRDLLTWGGEGREFTVSLRHWPEEGEEEDESFCWLERSVQIHQDRPQSHNNRDLLQTIRLMIEWLDAEKSFDITLSPLQSQPFGYEFGWN